MAAARGVDRVASLTPDNEPSRRLVTRLGVGCGVDGLLEGEGRLRLLDPARVDRRAVLALAADTTTAAPVVPRPSAPQRNLNGRHGR